MKPWHLLDEANVPGHEGRLSLHRRGDEYSIRLERAELMNSRMHASEEELARLACRALNNKGPRILIGGLGMGFTLAEVLRQVREAGARQAAKAEIVVAELVPAVVRWQRELLTALTGNPLADPSVRVEIADVGALIAAAADRYDAVILDVDNGPDALTHPGNAWLYGSPGLAAAHRALRPNGVLAVWSAESSPSFRGRLEHARFSVEEVRVRGSRGRGPHHWIWLARRKRA